MKANDVPVTRVVAEIDPFELTRVFVVGRRYDGALVALASSGDPREWDQDVAEFREKLDRGDYDPANHNVGDADDLISEVR